MDYEAYITSSFYSDTYKGVAISDDRFGRIALRASDEIDKMTMNFVRLNTIANLTEEAKTAVELATCVMAEALSKMEDLTSGTGVITTSESTNGLSYTIDKTSIDNITKNARSAAWTYLQRGGFYRGLYSGSGVLRAPI